MSVVAWEAGERQERGLQSQPGQRRRQEPMMDIVNIQAVRA